MKNNKFITELSRSESVELISDLLTRIVKTDEKESEECPVSVIAQAAIEYEREKAIYAIDAKHSIDITNCNDDYGAQIASVLDKHKH